MNYNTLFTIYHPYQNNYFYGYLYLILGINMFNHNIYEDNTRFPVYIKNNMIYSHRISLISFFRKNIIGYYIFTDEFSKGIEPILSVTIYEKTITVSFTYLYNFHLENTDMTNFLHHIEQAYQEFHNN
jgi:hypothetical protein